MLRSDVTRLLASAPLVALVAVTVAAPRSAHAQQTTGTVHGVVKDPSGKPFKGANVTLTSSSGEKLKTTSNSSGEYTFIGIQPGTYTLHVDVQSYSAPDQSVAVIQDQPTNADFALAQSTVETGTTKVAVTSGSSTTRAGQSNTQYNISSNTEQLTKSQPNNLYQFPGLVFGQPGITPDPSGYVHIRGSDMNQVGFDVDGIDVTEPMTNSFGTNIVTVGMKSANLLSGGDDASYGGKTGGYINEVTNNGRDIKGGILEYTDGPDWNYQGTHLEYGNVVGNGKLDYYGATILFQNSFPGNTDVSRVNPSNDELLKLNYYVDSKDTITGYINNGAEKYDYYQQPYSAAELSEGALYNRFNPYTGAITTSSNFLQDIDTQGYALSYLTYKHQFSSTSFVTLQQYKLFTHVQFELENLAGEYEDREATKSGTKLDYSNQLTTADTLQAGFQYIPEQTHYRLVADIFGPLSVVSDSNAAAPGNTYFNDFSSDVHPVETDAYISDQYKLAQNKVTIDGGLRYGQQHDGLQQVDYAAAGETAAEAASGAGLNHYEYGDFFSPHYVDPRVGVTYSPTTGANGITFRSSYVVNSQFADTDLINRIPTAMEPNGQSGTATAGSLQAQEQYVLGRYAPFNPLGPAHSNDFDLGVTKAFVAPGFFNGSYAASLTGFRRAQYDLIQYDRTDLNPLDGPRFYDNDGTGHSSGLEFQFSKRMVNKTDWNGFVSYTNQVAKATNSDFDTSYVPYFVDYAGGSPTLTSDQYRALDQNEFSTSYDQKHTIGAVASKRIFKFLSTAIVLDAGSGFPFAGGNASDGAFAPADAQHSEKVVGGADFTEVPTVLLNGTTLQPVNPVVGRTGWHYKFSLNTDFIIKEGTSAFVNIDNVFTRNTPLTYATTTQAGQIYYTAPSAAFPQGRVYYGPSTIITPRFISFGIRTKF